VNTKAMSNEMIIGLVLLIIGLIPAILITVQTQVTSGLKQGCNHNCICDDYSLGEEGREDRNEILYQCTPPEASDCCLDVDGNYIDCKDVTEIHGVIIPSVNVIRCIKDGVEVSCYNPALEKVTCYDAKGFKIPCLSDDVETCYEGLSRLDCDDPLAILSPTVTCYDSNSVKVRCDNPSVARRECLDASDKVISCYDEDAEREGHPEQCISGCFEVSTACNNNGVCNEGEDCHNAPLDCACPSGTTCVLMNNKYQCYKNPSPS